MTLTNTASVLAASTVESNGMQQVLDTVRDRTRSIEDHPLHSWLSEPDEHVEDERKLWFSLYFANFIMYFRELNLYHISYGANRDRDPLREALSRHADEDMTHSRLFVKDFRTLGMDKTLGWQPSQVLYWLNSSQINDPLRRRTSELTKLVASSEDPKILYPVVESFEVCGHALFKHMAVLAERITHRTGLPHGRCSVPPPLRGEVRAEIGDVMLYLCNLAATLDIDLVEAAQEKLAEAERRYPVTASSGAFGSELSKS